MRMLAAISGKSKAEALVAYLLTLQISTHVEPEGAGGNNDQWEIWIRDENRIDEARLELESYLENPDDSKYNDAIRHAQQIVQEKRKQRQDAARKVKTSRTVFRGGPMGMQGGVPPITLALIVIACVISLVTNFMNPTDSNKFGKLVLDELLFVSLQDYQPSPIDGVLPKQLDPAASLKKGEIWRIFTPIFPHGNTLHLLFNVLAIIQLGRIVEQMEGTLRFAFIVLITAVLSNIMQAFFPPQLFGNPLFGGLSGVVYGIFGFLLMKSNLRPEIGIRLSQNSVLIMLGWMVLGFTGLIGGIANMAHLGGFITGVLLASWDAHQANASKRN